MPKFAKFEEYFKNKAEDEILKRIDMILSVETSVNTPCTHFSCTDTGSPSSL